MVNPGSSHSEGGGDGAVAAGIQRELPHLSPTEHRELMRSLVRLVEAFAPETIYVFGSHARSAPRANSDIDLLIVVRASNEPPYRRAQRAYAAVGAHSVALDIQVMTRGEFEERLAAVSSLPATVVREGRVLYGSSAA